MKRLCALLSAFALLLTLCASASAVRAESTRSNGRPYYIMVNRAQNTVTVYAVGADGRYTNPVKAMVYSTGRAGHGTPKGTFSITGDKQRWLLMVDGSWGQYATRFNGHILFHSVCYSRRSASRLLTAEYNALGEKASLGCVRLQVADAKWIYDNCAAGTIVTVYESDDPGALGKPLPAVDEITPDTANGWDPTDPSRDNPWRSRWASALALNSAPLSLNAGQSASVPYSVTPSDCVQRVEWRSENPEVAAVNAFGTVTALSAGETTIVAICGELVERLPVSVSGELLPVQDMPPGVWYYNDVRYALERRIMEAPDNYFNPDAVITRAVAVQTLYNLSCEQGITTPTKSEGVKWFSKALSWAWKTGILSGMSRSDFLPDAPITRQEFAELLYRYETRCAKNSVVAYSRTLLTFADASDVHMMSESAMRWAVGRGLMNGDSENCLRPSATLTRAHLAVIYSRYAA